MVRLMTEEPCGRDYCDWFNPLMSFMEIPLFSGMVNRSCSARCSTSICQVIDVAEICCDGANKWADFRLQTCKEIVSQRLQEDRNQLTSYFRAWYPGRTAVVRPEAEPRNRAAVARPEVEPRNIKTMTEEEVNAFLYEKCTFKQCTKIGKGKVVSFKTEDFFISVTSGDNKANYYVNVTDRANAALPEATRQYCCTFSVLLSKVFWREENERRRVVL